MVSKFSICHNMCMINNMPKITGEHINQINKLISENPDMNRSALSRELCRLWDWRSPTGQIKDISARDMLRTLDKKGLICLPAAQKNPRAPGIGADKIIYVEHDTEPIEAKLREVSPIVIKIVSNKQERQLHKFLIHKYHYLSYDRSIGENIRYIVYSKDGRVLACLMFGASAWSCIARDDIIRWNAEQRRAGLPFITNNVRFLILPFVRVPHLASHILGAIARRISRDWQTKYGHDLILLETFIEQDRFKGIAYKAANWFWAGFTAGLGRNSSKDTAALPVKDVWLYPLCDDWKEKLRNAGGGSHG